MMDAEELLTEILKIQSEETLLGEFILAPGSKEIWWKYESEVEGVFEDKCQDVSDQKSGAMFPLERIVKQNDFTFDDSANCEGEGTFTIRPITIDDLTPEETRERNTKFINAQISNSKKNREVKNND